jgi:hypothetical protein
MKAILKSGWGLVLFAIFTLACSSDDTDVTPETSGASSSITAALASTASSNTACNASAGVAKAVCLAEAFKATLSSSQVSAMQLTYSLSNAKKWSNLPAGMSSRVGINLGTLSDAQLAAFRDLMIALMDVSATNEGYDEMLGNLVADDYLSTIGGGSTFGAGQFYIAFLGTPSATGLWEILFTGHHYTQPFTFNGGKLTGVTPAFRGVEPASAVTANGKTYQPFEQERAVFATMLGGLSTAEQATAKLSSTYSDILLGPGKDGSFPSSKSGLQVGILSAAKQALVLNAIKLYVNDLDATSAASILATYTNQLASTYISYSGTTAVSSQNDYVRIDGPNVWIEFSYQGGVIVRNTPHPHSVWRDRSGDYGGN